VIYRRLRRFVAFLIVFMAVGVILGGAVWWRWASRAARSGARESVRVTVPSAATVQSIGQDLEAKGVIRSALAFAWIGRSSPVRAGVYDFSPAESPRVILSRLSKGDVATVRVTFPEGFTVEQMARRLQREGLVADANTFLDLVTRQGNTLKASFSPPENLEGYLFPDTYRFPIGADERAIAERMLDEFDRLVATGKADEIRASGHSLAEIVNVAAMVEREAEVESDRPKIAGVIYNRLARGMKLQIDATVQYARGQHTSRLLYRDLEIDSPYNTYKINGLPPGPICCPGLPSIEAAIHPEKSNYLYYVGRPKEAHHFARTYEEHLRNVALVRQPPLPKP
jgi:UPF0755 protein